MPDLVKLLAPLGAVDHRVPSLPGVFSPVGVMIHHTASRIRQDPFPSLHICKVGRSDLKGPLCNVLIGRNAGIAVITDGRANDSGGGDPDVLSAIRNGKPLPAPNDTSSHRVNGNPWFYDLEVENDGIGEEYHPRVLAATGAVAAAICRHHGWGVDRVLLHRQWTRRKIDWSWQGDTRALVAKYLTEPEEEDVPQPSIVTVNGVPHVFVRGTDGALHVHTPHEGWGRLSKPNELTSGPSVTLAPNGMVDVAVRGSDGGHYTAKFNPKDRSFSGWTDIGGKS